MSLHLKNEVGQGIACFIDLKTVELRGVMKMPKIKTNRGAAKRFRVTASGRIKRGQSHRRHILTKKSSKRKRHLREPNPVNACDTASIRQMLPYA